MSKWPVEGITDDNTDSTPKVPLPWIRIASKPSSRVTAQREESDADIAEEFEKESSREPMSHGMACFTVRLAVKGPGVNNVLSLAVGNTRGSFIGCSCSSVVSLQGNRKRPDLGVT